MSGNIGYVPGSDPELRMLIRGVVRAEQEGRLAEWQIARWVIDDELATEPGRRDRHEQLMAHDAKRQGEAAAPAERDAEAARRTEAAAQAERDAEAARQAEAAAQAERDAKAREAANQSARDAMIGSLQEQGARHAELIDEAHTRIGWTEELIKEVRSGLARLGARFDGIVELVTKPLRRPGRKPVFRKTLTETVRRDLGLKPKVTALAAEGLTKLAIAESLGIDEPTVGRILYLPDLVQQILERPVTYAKLYECDHRTLKEAVAGF